MNLLESYLNNSTHLSKNVFLTTLRLFNENKLEEEQISLFLNKILTEDSDKIKSYDIQYLIFLEDNTLVHSLFKLLMENNLLINTHSLNEFITNNIDYYFLLPLNDKFLYLIEYYYSNKKEIVPILEEMIILLNNENMTKELFSIFQQLLTSDSISFYHDIDQNSINLLYKFIKTCFNKFVFLKSFDFKSSCSIEEFLFTSLHNYYHDDFINDILKKEKYILNFDYFNKDTLFYFLTTQSNKEIFNFLLSYFNEEYLNNLKYNLILESENYDIDDYNEVKNLISIQLNKLTLNKELESF